MYFERFDSLVNYNPLEMQMVFKKIDYFRNTTSMAVSQDSYNVLSSTTMLGASSIPMH